MQSLLTLILGGLVRMVMGGVASWLLTRGVLNESQVLELLAGVTTALAGLVWIVWDKVKAARVLNTAVASAPTTVASVEAQVAAGQFAPALTPKTDTPVISPGGNDAENQDTAALITPAPPVKRLATLKRPKGGPR